AADRSGCCRKIAHVVDRPDLEIRRVGSRAGQHLFQEIPRPGGQNGWRCGENVTMAAVVDDLVAWLVGVLAEASRKGLVSFVLGSDLERALSAAARAAVTGTAAELRPGGGEPAEELARVIGEVFRARGPREFDVAGGRTLLEAIGSGVSAQVA